MRAAGMRAERPAAAPTAALAVEPLALALAGRGLPAADLARRGPLAAVLTGVPAAGLAMVHAGALADPRPESLAASRGAGPDSGQVWPLRFLPGQSASREPASGIPGTAQHSCPYTP